MISLNPDLFIQGLKLCSTIYSIFENQGISKKEKLLISIVVKFLLFTFLFVDIYKLEGCSGSESFSH